MNSYVFSNGAFPDVVNTPATVSQQKIQTIMSYALDFLIGIILQHKQGNKFVLFLRYLLGGGGGGNPLLFLSKISQQKELLGVLLQRL